MTNRNALRRLSRKLPPPPEVQRIMASLRTGTDLTVAITGTAVLEATLEQLLIEKFYSSRAELVGQIFNTRGPLSDFNGKILVAEAFGIVTRIMAQELHSVRAIRNTFAHAKLPLSFDHELIEKEVRSLKMINAIQDRAEEEVHWFDVDNKGRFLLAAQILLSMFEEIKNNSGTANEILKRALSETKSTSRGKS